MALELTDLMAKKAKSVPSVEDPAPPRPQPKICQEFYPSQTSLEFINGSFTWSVLCGIAIVQDGLTRLEAEVLATSLNKPLEGFRVWRKISLAPGAQQLLNFETKEAAA